MLRWLPWPDAAGVAAGCAAATVTLAHHRRRPLRAVATWTRELTIMFVLYGLWQLAGDLSLGQGGSAVTRGRAIWRLERALGLPTEGAVQRLVLGDHELIRWFNIYYAQLHVAALGVCLVWLFARHRDRYPAVRNVLAIVTGACLLIQLVPVAPPRLVAGLGLVDTGRLVGPSVYPATAAPGLDQLSAMPSLHVAWAVVVAGSLIYTLHSSWRWLAAIYPACTWFIVIVTGNHYWADGIVAVVLCALATAGLAVGGSWWRRRRSTGLRRRATSADTPPPPRDRAGPTGPVGVGGGAFRATPVE